MKKTLSTILLLTTCSASFAATTMVDSLHSGLKYWWDFQSNANPVDYSSGSPVQGGAWGENFGWSAGQEHGTLSSTAHPYKANPGLKANSFTLSFDIKNLAAGAWKNIVSINTNGGLGDSNSLSLQTTTTTGDVSLFGSNFGTTGNTAIDGQTAISTDWMTFTITCDGNTLSLYQNGLLVGSREYLVGNVDITGIQFGQSFGGGRGITSADIDNVGLWDKALTADEIKLLNGLTVPEPATATLGLLGLSALFLRRRRK